MDIKLSVPFAKDLSKEAGWIHLDKYLYFVPRFHLHVEQNQTNEFAVGDILRTYRTTSHSETEGVKSFEEEFTISDIKETTRSITLSNDLSQKVAATIAGAAKSPFYEVSAEVEASLEQTVRSSMGQSLRSSETIARRVRKSFTIRQKIKSGAGELHLAVAGYRKYRQDVYLHYIDYLFVEYSSKGFGLRKKRNLPRPVGITHINRLPIQIPLFSLFYWDLELENSLLYTETEYRSLPKVSHPDRVTFEELHAELSLPLPSRPELPTLYTLSNRAFPLRWIDRKGPRAGEDPE